MRSFLVVFSGFVQVERFLDTDNAALLSMHYPQGAQDIHAGTAPFDSREQREGESYEDDAQQLQEARMTGEEEEGRSGKGPRGLFGEILSSATVRRYVANVLLRDALLIIIVWY